MEFIVKEATLYELEWIWDKNINANIGDDKWVKWGADIVTKFKMGVLGSKPFVALHDDEPIGECYMIISPENDAISGRMELADGKTVANINALRVEKRFRGNGISSKLIKHIEQYAVKAGYKRLTIGVEPNETRNIAIYLHWGYNEFVMYDIEEEDELVLYYAKEL